MPLAALPSGRSPRLPRSGLKRVRVPAQTCLSARVPRPDWRVLLSPGTIGHCSPCLCLIMRLWGPCEPAHWSASMLFACELH